MRTVTSSFVPETARAGPPCYGYDNAPPAASAAARAPGAAEICLDRDRQAPLG